MATPPLKTKLYIPPPRRDWVPRPRLIERLGQGLALGPAGFERKLTLISAPAGFGKSTLLSAWAASTRQPVAWVSLDDGDNDPTRFWTYVITALQTRRPALGALALAAIQSRQPPAIEALLAGLINELAGMPGTLVLVLDDYHVISAPQIHDAVAFFLDHMPPQLHLVLSSRANPPWPLARIRARREITELRIDDLRFTPIEAAAFLNDVMGLGLSAEDVATLETRTEGWIAGLQLAALSMQGGTDTTSFIQAFSGSHHFVLDYLVEEVLDRQPPGVQSFLLRTSFLEHLTAPLCDAVRFGEGELPGGEDSQTILEQLEQANLFLVPLDDERRWYRYHHLFADLLRSRLKLAEPGRMPELHRRASAWYAQNGLIAEAVSHALATGNIPQAARLVEENAFTLVYHGELTTLLRQLDALPQDLVRLRPQLCVARAWAQAYTGQVEVVEPLLRGAEKTLVELPDHAETQGIAGRIAFLRAYVAAFRGDMPRAAELAREALEYLPESDMPTRGLASVVLGVVLQVSGDLAAAAQSLDQAVAISRAAGDDCATVDVLCDLVGLQVVRGQLREAAATCQEALRLADECVRRVGRRPPVIGYVYIRLSGVLREWNELENALRYAQKGFELYRHWGQPDYLRMAHGEMARILQALGDKDGALDAAQEARRVARELSPRGNDLAAAWEAQIRLAQGDVAAASRWIQESGLRGEDELNYQNEPVYRILARVLIAQGRPAQALELLDRLLQVVEGAGAAGSIIEVLVLQAMALQGMGRQAWALAVLERALSLAEPEGYVGTFIGEGAPMERLLRRAIAQGLAVRYAGRLLAALGTKREPGPFPADVEPLSERELEVLRLLTTRLTVPEIARELYVAATTVRSHVRSIYGKLGVHNRIEAVSRARQLDLL
jgi:LuxR family maltose regulon positive regulatory protein